MTTLQPKSMDDFFDSFNIIFGTVDRDLNLFNNGYFDVNVYELDNAWMPKISDDIKLRKCDKDTDMAFMPDNVKLYYPNTLCFERRDQIKLFGNWFDLKY